MRFIQALRNRILRKSFGFFEKLGVHVLPVHYYSPIPDTRLFKNDDSGFNTPSNLAGVSMNEEAQVKLANQICPAYYDEYSGIPIKATADRSEYYLDNDSFGFASGQMHYSLVRHFKPKRIVEVGSGYSSLISLKAIRQNKKADGHRSHLTAIEPYPRDFLRKVEGDDFKLVNSKVEDLPTSTFDQLGMNDFLFIDSSHVAKFGSDVNFLMFEIIPRLAEGVIVHIHDIQFPFDYFKPYIMKQRLFWNEQYVVQAFLMFNDSFEILWCGSYMAWRHPELISQYFPHSDPSRISTSLYIRKIK